MATLTASTDTASTIHKQIKANELARDGIKHSPELYAHYTKQIKALRRKLNRVNYEASL